MEKSGNTSKLYSFYKAVVTVTGFAACFYLFIVCYIATYRHISDIGTIRVLFLNPLLILTAALVLIVWGGFLIYRSPKASKAFLKLENEETYKRAMSILKLIIFIESALFAVSAFGMSQRVDQLKVQEAAYAFSWGNKETLTPPGYLGIYPNNLGMAVVLYLLSGITGHYNNAAFMMINALLVPFIYSDLAAIGGKFGLSRKSQIMVMIAGVFFLPLQAKVMIIYGDVPGLFFAIRAMKHASYIASSKSSKKSIFTVIAFMAIACVFKNNFIIFAIAVTIYLAAEFLRQKRFKELLIPVCVIISSVLLNTVVGLIAGAALGGSISSGASKYSWIAMGMQEEAGMYNGYNALTYAQSGFDSSVQSAVAKKDIAQSINSFIAEPNYAFGFYIRKILIQWSDPTHNAFEFAARNVYPDGNPSPFVWFMSSPKVMSVFSSFLKIFQLLMFLGSSVFAVKTMRRKTGSPALLLTLAFAGGYVFHIIWEAAPYYTMSYMTLLIPTGVAGLIALIKKLTTVKIKELTKAKISISASGLALFIAGALVFLLAAAGLGAIKTLLANGRSEYRTYMNETALLSREPVAEGTYRLLPAADDFDGEGLKVKLTRYAGKYRMRILSPEIKDELYMTSSGNSVKIDWFSNDSSQAFVIIRNANGTYSICQGEMKALSRDPAGGIKMGEFTDYTFLFGSPDYDQYISDHPNMTWRFVPAT